MAKSTAKKRGRPRKPLVVISLRDAQREWEPRLRRIGNPEEIHHKEEISEKSLRYTERDAVGRRIRPTKVIYGESIEHQSATQQTDWHLSTLLEAAADEGIVLSAPWRLYMEYMDVVAEELYRKNRDKRAALNRLILEDARSRHDEKPTVFPAEIGTPAEFRASLARYEMELRLIPGRRDQIIKIIIIPLPPDEEEEDYDESEGPKGHWEGLKWFADPQE